jgi:hypothetical protein
LKAKEPRQKAKVLKGTAPVYLARVFFLAFAFLLLPFAFLLLPFAFLLLPFAFHHHHVGATHKLMVMSQAPCVGKACRLYNCSVYDICQSAPRSPPC